MHAESAPTDWSHWRRHFDRNATRPLPPVEDLRSLLPTPVLAHLLPALARFQLGECGEGRIAREIYRAPLPGIDDDYRVALGRFVREEGRHARILASMIRGSGGALLRSSWTRGIFTAGRRAAGPRTKLVALMAAEVVGIAFYGAVSDKLPPGSSRRALAQICEDERAHLAFHVDFFRAQAALDPKWRPRFAPLWWAAAGAGASLMVLDNRTALAALGVAPAKLWRRQMELAAEIAAEVTTGVKVEIDPRPRAQGAALGSSRAPAPWSRAPQSL